MQELVKIREQDGKQSVSARELHGFLESKQQFSDWIKNRIEKYEFVENQDFILISENYEIKEGRGGDRRSIDYALTLDTAKELSMVEGNEKGKQARRYFIACEKRLKEIGRFQIPTTLSGALRLAAEQADKIDEQQKQLEEQQPKVLFAMAVETSDRSVLIAELAKVICQNGVDIGQNRLFQWLRSNGFLGRWGEYYNQPTQMAMEMGLFEIKKTSITKPDGSVLVNTTPKVTGKGQVYFVNKFLNDKT